jgi:hypothetical protein
MGGCLIIIIQGDWFIKELTGIDVCGLTGSSTALQQQRRGKSKNYHCVTTGDELIASRPKNGLLQLISSFVIIIGEKGNFSCNQRINMLF